MGTEQKPEKNVQKTNSLTGNKTFLIIIGCWFLFYIFVSLNGGGG